MIVITKLKNTFKYRHTLVFFRLALIKVKYETEWKNNIKQYSILLRALDEKHQDICT